MADPVRCTDRPDDPPHKRLRLKLDLEAHDLDDLTARLYDILTRLDVDGSESTRRISGSYTLNLTCDEEMTEERFVAELDAWVQRRKEAKSDA